MSRRSQCHLHGRQGIRHKLPVIVLQYCAQRSGVPDRLRLFPVAIGAGFSAIPLPVKHVSIDALGWFGNIVLPSHRFRSGQYLDALLFFHLPGCVRVGYPLCFAGSVEKKSRTIADLCQRSKQAKIPDCGGQDVSPRM